MKLVAMTVLCVDVYERQNTVCVGGNSVNFAVQACHDGVETVSLLGVIGNDSHGKAVLQVLGAHPIDLSHVRIREGRTASNRILVDDHGERSFPEGAWDGGVYQTFALTEDDWAFVATHDVVAIPANNFNFREAIRRKRPHQLLTVDFLDLRDWSLMEETIPHLDLAFISGDDEVVEFVRDLTTRVSTLVTVTLGARGSLSFHGGREWAMPAVPVDEVKDTTGCGDAYQSAFTTEYFHHRDLVGAQRAGSLAAARILGHVGALS